MSDDSAPTVDQDSAADIGHDIGAPRTTAPMSEYGSRAVGIGFAVALVGVILTIGIPLAVVGL